MAVSSKEPPAAELTRRNTSGSNPSPANTFQKLPVPRVAKRQLSSKNKKTDDVEDKSDASGWRNFLLRCSRWRWHLVLAIYSGAAAQTGARWVAGITALSALAVAGWVAITICTGAGAANDAATGLTFRVHYRLTLEGNCLSRSEYLWSRRRDSIPETIYFFWFSDAWWRELFLSGILSHITLTGVELHLELPEHVFAGEPAPAVVELTNSKRVMPSFALRVMGQKIDNKSSAAETKKSEIGAALLDRPVYFPYLPRGQSVRNRVELLFPKRGVYRQETLALRSRFPFGFLEKTRKLPARRGN